MKKNKNLDNKSSFGYKLKSKVTITILFLIFTISVIKANNYIENNGNKFIFKTEEQSQIKITGVIYDELNQPMFGVNILAKDTKIGTSSSFDGSFKLSVPTGTTTLIITYIGYKVQEIEIGQKTNFEIQIFPEASGLQEVIVVGYGTQKKKDVLGAISSVKGEDLTLSSSPSILQGIQGKAAGLQIVQNSAQPGGGLNIQIRGGGSQNAGNAPLIVVDGFVITDFDVPSSGNRYDGGTQGILNSFNPNDIESVEVLKDAAAAAIYGSRAANGVILITTKKGKEGDVKVDFSSSTTLQAYNRNYDVLNLKEWMQLRNVAAFEKWQFENRVFPYSARTLEEANANPVNGIPFTRYFSDQQIRDAGDGTDWLSLVTRNGTIEQHNLSLRGGTENTKYFMSGNYYNHDGVVRNSGFNRTSFRINLDQKINDYINLGLNFTTSNIKNKYVPLGGQFQENGEEVSQFENSGIIRAALQQSPYIQAIDEFGNYPINPELSQQPNPYSLLTISDEGNISRNLANFYLEIKPFAGLTARLSAGYDKGESSRNTYLPRTTLAGALENGRASIGNNRKNDDLFDFTLTYNKRLNEKHNFTALLGYSLQTYRIEQNTAGNTNFVTDAFLWNNLNAGAGTKITTSTKRESNFKSYFGRLNYSYRDRYLLTGIVRRDFASGNSANFKWGTFPSISFGWDIAAESFMESLGNNLSQLKLRFGYGALGNADREGNSFAAYSSFPGYLSPNETIIQGVFLTRLGNPDLKWETTTEKNFGLDFEVLNRRVSGSIEVYNRVISDLLATKDLNSYQEVATLAANIGATETNGIELTLNTINVNAKNFKWKSNLVYATYKTNWKERAPDWKPAVYESYNDPLRAQYSQLADGIMQVGEIVPAQPDLLPGQIKIKDINGFVRDGAGNPVADANGIFLRTGEPDGRIDVADTVLLGTSDPDFVLGLGNTFTYKNFQLNFQFNGSFGRKIVNQTDLIYGTSADGLAQFGYNATTRIYDRWTPDNPSTTRPGSNYGYSQYGVGDFFLEDASFLRLQTMSFSYMIPTKWASKYLTSAAIRLDAQNLFIITKYKGIDPETDGYTAAYPNVKNYTLGIDLKF